MKRLALALMLVLPACGGDDDDDDDNTPDANPIVYDAAAPPPDAPGPDAAPPVTLIAADRNGDIYSIDETTGADTMILDVMGPTGGVPPDIGVVSSMVYVSSQGELWMGTGGNGTCGGCILVLNPSDGATQILTSADGAGGTPNLGAIPSLAYDPVGDVVFTTTADSSGSLYSFAVANGDVTEAATGVTDGQSGKGMTFDGSGVLHVSGDDELFTVDTSTGATVSLGTVTYTGFPAFVGGRNTLGSLARNPNTGVVYAILMDGGGGGVDVTYTVTVDLTTRVVTNVGVNTVILDGLAFVPESLFGS